MTDHPSGLNKPSRNPAVPSLRRDAKRASRPKRLQSIKSLRFNMLAVLIDHSADFVALIASWRFNVDQGALDFSH